MRGGIGRLARRALVIPALGLALAGKNARAHPIHTTLTVITSADADRTISLAIRVFADDFSAAVARFAGRSPPPDSSVVPREVERYVRARVTVDAGSGPLELRPCGITRAREVFVLCFRATSVAGVRHIQVRNVLLAELHADQVNILRLERGAARRTVLCTPRSPTTVVQW